MAHFAKVENGIVTEVIVAENHVIESGLLGDPSLWIQTSYNTRGGVHLNEDMQPTGRPGLRKNFAGIGYTYDKEKDAFIPPKPYESWQLNEDTCSWQAPVPIPTDGKLYNWNESEVKWEEVVLPGA